VLEPSSRLLRWLACANVVAERRDGAIILLERNGHAWTEAARFPREALAPLVESGAVTCRMEGGRPRFSISDAGHAALFRLGNARSGATGPEHAANPFGDQHRAIVTRIEAQPEGEQVLRVNLREDPLALLQRQKDGFARDFIGAAAIEAGTRLARDMRLGKIEPRMNVDLTRVSVDGGAAGGLIALPEAAMEARERVRRALGAVGPDHADILMDVCGFSRGLEQIESARRLPARSAKLWLGLALRSLARHYGIDDEARGKTRASIRAARSPD
jgi:hypothetical protein